MNGILHMEDSAENEVVSLGEAPLETMIVPTLPDDTHSIAEFLKRPARVWSVGWTSGATFTWVNPWNLFFNSPRIARKIANFHKLHTGGLKVTIVSNGTPFTYGRVGVAYMPFHGSYARPTQNYQEMTTMPFFSMLDPSQDTTLEFTIPEFVQEEIVIPTNDMSGIGSFLIQTVAALASAASAGSAPPSMDIQMFVSCVNPRVIYGTSRPPYFATSGEYKGKLSGPLSTIAKASNLLSTVPVLAPFATAAGTAAKMGAGLANMFGYSRPPNSSIASDSTFQNRHVGNMANTVGLDTTLVLAMEPNALSPSDPQYFGLPRTDEMVISEIASRYSLLETFNWSDASSLDIRIADYSVGPASMYTHLGFMSNPFQYWRGSIKYKIVFPVSHFHTGRMRVTFVPGRQATPTGVDPSNLQLNWIIDLSKGAELECVIPYSYHRPLCPVNYVYEYGVFDSLPDSLWQPLANSDTSMGSLEFYPLTPLRAGAAATTVKVLVFIAAGDDFELFGFNLTNQMSKLYKWENEPTAPNTGYDPPNRYKWYATSGSAEEDSPLISLTAASERVLSFRPLLKRYQLTRVNVVGEASDQVQYYCTRMYPNATGTVTILNDKYAGSYSDASSVPCLFSYLMPAYAGVRGGMRIKQIGTKRDAKMRTIFRTIEPVTNFMTGDIGDPGIAQNNLEINMGFATGGELVVHTDRYGSEVTMPHCSDLQFFKTADVISPVYPTPGIVMTTLTPDLDGEANHKLTFMAAADDFNLLWYIGVPRFVRNDQNPPG